MHNQNSREDDFIFQIRSSLSNSDCACSGWLYQRPQNKYFLLLHHNRENRDKQRENTICNVRKNDDYCYVKMPTEDNKILR